MKKRIIICALIIVAMSTIMLLWHSNRIIGRLSGIENEKVIFDDGSSYLICEDNHSHKDKGWILGKITGAYNTSYYVFSVRGNSSDECIYVSAMGQGEFYKRIN